MLQADSEFVPQAKRAYWVRVFVCMYVCTWMWTCWGNSEFLPQKTGKNARACLFARMYECKTKICGLQQADSSGKDGWRL